MNPNLIVYNIFNCHIPSKIAIENRQQIDFGNPDRRGIWGDERYLAKKAAMEGANIEREVMPDRVCRWVRYWYPNLPSKPYMGHKNK